MSESKQKTILITGAAGNLGRKLVAHLEGKYTLRLLDVGANDDARIVQADLSVWSEDWVSLFAEVDVVVHLAADSAPDTGWNELIAPNIDGIVHVYEAAVLHNVPRFVFASSNHVMGGYRELDSSILIHPDSPVWPGTVMTQRDNQVSIPYAATKLMGERLGKCYADIYDLSVVAVRIGVVRPDENSPETMWQRYEDAWWRQMWLSNRDYCQLMTRCIEAKLLSKFVIVNGMSKNEGMRWDVAQAQQAIGYTPKDGLKNKPIL